VQRVAGENKWDTDYEWKVVALLGVGFGMVGLDRWIIAPLFPFIARDLGLDPGAIGTLSGVLGIVWGICAIFRVPIGDGGNPSPLGEAKIV
jgi:MFS family permease